MDAWVHQLRWLILVCEGFQWNWFQTNPTNQQVVNDQQSFDRHHDSWLVWTQQARICSL